MTLKRVFARQKRDQYIQNAVDGGAQELGSL